MMVQAATIIPVAGEKLPLYHWRPGVRLLSVGSRDGAHFHGDPQADANTFQRTVDSAMVAEVQRKSGCIGLAATWNNALSDDRLEGLFAADPGLVVVATPGIGEVALLDRALPRVTAWVLLVPEIPGPLARRLLESATHVEILVGLRSARIPDLPWHLAQAVHLVAERPAEADNLDIWVAEARGRFPPGLAVYDYHHPHTDCRCGERLVWRAPGRSRIDGLAVETGKCKKCGKTSGIFL